MIMFSKNIFQTADKSDEHVARALLRSKCISKRYSEICAPIFWYCHFTTLSLFISLEITKHDCRRKCIVAPATRESPQDM